jgi:type IV pilus assembly protein PilC
MSNFFVSLSIQDKTLFAKRLAVLIKSGVPILTSLRILRKQADSRSARKILDQIILDVEHGQFLSSGMAKFRAVFTDFGINIIKVGEVSGTLHENLNYLADELKKKQALRRKVINALVYPVFIIFATLGITGMLTVYVFPKILPIFKSLKFDLPLSTKILIMISDVFLNYGWFILFGVIVFAIGMWFLMRVPAFRFLADHFVLKIPILGKLSRSYQMANFCRTLGILLESGVKIVDATKITSKSITNLAYQKQLNLLAENILKGERISTHMDRSPRLFPPILTQMVLVGETSGNLSDSLMYLAEMYENEVDDLTKNLSNVIEPVLMIFMGLIVGFIAVSIITPIYGITQNLNPK